MQTHVQPGDMLKQIVILLLFIAVCGNVFGQSNSTSVYKGLKTKKFYSAQLTSRTENGKHTYQVNGEQVSKFRYKKYTSTWKNMENCCPCVLRTYDVDHILLSEAVSCTDCGVGDFTTYYPNGQVSSSGRYKENATGNWNDIWDRGFCSVPDGQWTYFNEQGDTLYAEFWKDGIFIRQVPEQETCEIWDVTLTRNGETIDKQPLTVEQVNELVITPKYKNSHQDSVQVTIDFNIIAIGYKPITQSFTLENFKHIDVQKLLAENGIPANADATYSLAVKYQARSVAQFYLNIQD